METLDLREEPQQRLGLAAAAAIRDAGGEGLRMLTRDDPALLLASLDLQFRQALAWESRHAGDHWETHLRRAAEAAPRDLVDRLVRDHRRMDEQLARALRHLNAGDQPAAQGLLRDFAQGLQSHVLAENELLAPRLGPEVDAAPLEAMLREHDELLAQLAAVEEVLEGEAWELETYVALLSGTLAKHEHREETSLFPGWRARLLEMPPAEREQIEAAFSVRVPR